MPHRNKRSVRKNPINNPGSADFPLLFLSIGIIGFGLIMVLTSSSVRGYYSNDNSYFFFLQQLKWVFLGSVACFFFYKVPYFTWKRYAGLGLIAIIFLLILVLITDAGIVSKGSARWLKIGPISLQPSEFAKLGLILFLAKTFDKYPVTRAADLLLPVVLISPVFYSVYKQPDLGTTMVLFATFLAMVWQTELKTAWFITLAPIAGGVIGYLIRHTDYQWKRILAWLDPWAYATSLGWQITNAEIAFGTGGLLGVGIGQSRQKYGFLSENHTDTIFAIIGEELGFIGSITLLLGFIFFIVRGFTIAKHCQDRFGRLLSFGITFSLAIQILINLSVVTGLIPVTGVTLPLISYGGSSLIVTMSEIGMLLNISRYNKHTVNIPISNRVIV